MSPVLTNVYFNDSWLFVDSYCMLSKEGITKDDMLVMAMYVTRTQPSKEYNSQ